jgi:outer membrane protein OmpA-like peptidoglycan-associated protein
MKIKPAGKAAILILVIGIVFGIVKFFNLLPGGPTAVSVVPTTGNLPGRTASSGTGASIPLPGSGAGCTDKPEVRLLGYAWNAQMGMHFASGGPQATHNSLMCDHGVNFKFARQDDNSKLQEALTAFATQLSQGSPNPDKGAHFVTIMGDGSAAFLKPLNDTLKRLGPEYTAKVVGSAGYSVGEDKLMGPPEWKTNPAASRGSLVAGVLRDGDWNIAQKWLGDNSLRTNPDEKTWDPDAVNWVNANDYIDAAQKYIAGYHETRPVVRNGKRTGETKDVTVTACVTWTPGDVTVAEKKGGIVSIVSTKEYSSQMPCIIIGIDKWMKANRSTVEGMLQAIAEGGDAVKSNPAALKKASEVSNEVYHENGTDPSYWERYYKGIQQQDRTGISVDLGGSSANNLADMLLTFGLVPGSANLYGATYKVFGDIVATQYPDLLKGYDPVEQITDTSYLQDIARQAKPTAAQVAAAKPVFSSGQRVTKTVSRKAWHINFDSGRAVFSGSASKQLDQLRRDLLVASGAAVEIHGYTDNQGNPNANRQLSEDRAFAVKKWMEKAAPVNFPAGRIRVFKHGDDNPVESNSTPQGRAANRRVEVVIGTTSS